MRIPDQAERFPEGMNGVDMTDRLLTPSGYMGHYNTPSVDDLIEGDRIMKQQELEWEIKKAQEKYKVDEETAKEIVKAKAEAEDKIREIEFERDQEICEIMKKNGYESYYDDIPF